MTINFDPVKLTKNTVKFSERVTNEIDGCKVGTIYVQKSVLKEMGYKKDQGVSINLSLN